ncbi:MucR family transcriptional regulator [Microvirga aerophila]|uniref:MucR family transcriptional regulator n=1 Tax=Microvirga aerophila TaxID=670291 RepID=A0A512C3H3_9HYPH|nr:MucR family transcriptional regulator [Microvirga aerophila]GEO18587.1 MucR family transcriptional regulator [Microvirga aerophila]
MTNETTPNYMELAADIVSAFVSNNSVPVTELSSLIANVHASLQNVGQPARKQDDAKPAPAVSVRKSVTPDYLISLEDGKQYKSLKRHLGKLGLTPEAYREKWGLPRDYPMVAPNYAAKRSELAKSMGLGQQRSKAAQAKAAANDTVVTTPAKAPAKRGRKKAA